MGAKLEFQEMPNWKNAETALPAPGERVVAELTDGNTIIAFMYDDLWIDLLDGAFEDEETDVVRWREMTLVDVSEVGKALAQRALN
jgi:hypothetical protein